MGERNILFVDDEVLILNMMKEVFTLRDYKVFTAENGVNALEILKKDNLMVMFLDLQLPDMSGIDLCRQIRKNNQFSIINALTGYSNLFGLLECRSSGFDDFFTKPVSLKTLFKAADDAFEKIERWKVFEYDLA